MHVSGIRAADMANRLKYAGLDAQVIHMNTSFDGALDGSVATLPAGETLYVLPTYTAMLAFRKLLHDRGWVQSQFWED